MTMRHVKSRCGVGLGLGLAAALAVAQGPWADSYTAESQGDYATAILALDAILDANPEHEFAILRTAWLKYLLGDYNASIRDYETALQINRDSLEAQLGLTLPLLAQRRWREAAAAAQAVLEEAPWHYYAHIRLLIAEEGQRQWETLARHARELSTRYPSDTSVLVYLARAEARQGNLESALREYRRVLERMPAHEEAAVFVAQNGQ
jgi:tetratricopeptide (TPR) repeat protein